MLAPIASRQPAVDRLHQMTRGDVIVVCRRQLHGHTMAMVANQRDVQEPLIIRARNIEDVKLPAFAAGPQILIDDMRIAAGVGDAPSAMSLLDASRTDAVLVAPGTLTAQLPAGGWTRALTDPTGMELWFRGDPTWARGASC